MRQQGVQTSSERVRAALTGAQVDRVPIVEFVVDPKVAFALMPGARDVAEACDHLGLDSVGSLAKFLRVAEGDGKFVDEWGVTYGAGPHVVAHPVRGPITGRDDLARWTPPDPDAPYRFEALRDVVARYKGKRAILFHHRVAFMYSAFLVGLDRLLELFYEDPGFVHELFERVVTVNERIIRNAIRAGAEVVSLGDDYASNQAPLFSPRMFREFVLPYLQRVVNAIHEEGALAVKHTDGNIWPILADIVNTGVDGLHPLEPVAGMDLGEVKRAFGDRVCLIGNIDCGELLCSGTTEEVETAVREAIRVAAPGGRYMLSSSNSVHAGVKPENYKAMIEAGRRYGDYAALEAT